MQKILIVGYGGIGQALTPLLFRHFPQLSSEQIQIITADERGHAIAKSYGIAFHIEPLTEQNYGDVLGHALPYGGMLINVSVGVSSFALIKWCRDNDVLYIDTCIEPWAGGYDDVLFEANQTTNYWLREQVLSLRGKDLPTAVIAQGANPGLVTHFVKKGLLELAKEQGISADVPFADMAMQLGVRTIQVAERDTQYDGNPLSEGEFANTWSVDGLLSEGYQRAEMGWGTHERTLPPLAHAHSIGSACGIVLAERSATVKVKSWVPSVGEQQAYMVTHHEALSIADFLTVRQNRSEVIYRPTVFYAYRPSDKTCASLENWVKRKFAPPRTKTLMRDELCGGFDELGVLFVLDDCSYWYGSTLTHKEAATIASHNNATSLQVVSTMIGAIQWAIEHPRQGVVEAEDIPHEAVLSIALPYLGKVRGIKSDWHPARNGMVQFADFFGDSKTI